MGTDGEGRKNVDREGLKKAARLAAAMSPADRERVIAQLPGEIARALRAELSVLAANDRADEALQSDFLTAWRTPKAARTQPPADIPDGGPRDTDQKSLDRQRRQEYLDRLLTGELDEDLDDVLGGAIDNGQTPDVPADDDQNDAAPADDPQNNDFQSDDGDSDEILYRIDPAAQEEHVPRFAPAPVPIRREGESPAKEPAPAKRPRRRLTIGWKIGPSKPADPKEQTGPKEQIDPKEKEPAEPVPAEPVIPWAGGSSLPREDILAQCRRAAGERPQTIAAWLRPLSPEETEEYLRCFPEEQRAEIRRRLERLDGVDLSIGELLGRHLGWPGAMGKEVLPR